ncbi:hypothetical protein BpHYR1_023342 [Brachionus plicatilis]|uniref:Uncharacterized protein n=1 Tax=Brachionus plicatilis TaxID=10195 RepID=A0A3M7SRE3_BRAPC|nr:hypothetical protein BpHYR1_023342 [Brachionus plicatilis]
MGRRSSPFRELFWTLEKILQHTLLHLLAPLKIILGKKEFVQFVFDIHKTNFLGNGFDLTQRIIRMYKEH